ncbi:serine hydrolase domain-containing protein [Hyalangium gracile]|uniref:serine hydrolase domain-containing protein n=1 Tax=Hyalangium gracile TaxID=394092 RepID=UPI001CCBB66F|nr:serine hydrolase domain-containing protein [Hyalangium gracile]
MHKSFPHDPVVAPASAGMDPARLERALGLFRAQQARGAFPGGQLVVRRAGHCVANLAVGLARGFRQEVAEAVVTPETRFNVFSASKPLVALAIARLEEAGQVELSAPVARYFPEFAAHGKDAITLLDVLTHRGGVLLPDFIQSWEKWGDWDAVVDALVRAVPRYRRGTLAYHPNEFGWILAEVVRRVTGQPLPALCERELLAPAGVVGMRFQGRAEEASQVARSYWVGSRAVRVHEVDVSAQLETVYNAPQVLTAFVPGASLWTDAAHLAALYELLVSGGVARGGQRLLAESTVRAYTARAVFGLDRSNRLPFSAGRGFLVGTPWPSFYGAWATSSCFGHAGAFCTLGFGDHATGLAVGIITNGNAGPGDFLNRFRPLVSALRRACVHPVKSTG